jgi:hypothetical protein
LGWSALRDRRLRPLLRIGGHWTSRRVCCALIIVEQFTLELPATALQQDAPG